MTAQERMSLMQHVLHEMKLAVDHDGDPLFEPAVIAKVVKRSVDGCLGS